MLRSDCPALVADGSRPQLPDQFDDRRPDGHKNDRGQNKDHQWGNHLDCSFRCLFFGSLPAFRAEGVGMHSESLSDAGTEAISLYQCTNKRTDVVNTGALHEVTEGLGAGLAGAQLEIDEVEFVAQIGMCMVQILSDAAQRLIQGKASLDADHGQVEGIGQSQADAVLPVFDHALQDEAGKDEPERGYADEEREIIESGESGDRDESDGRAQNAGAEIVVNLDGIAEPGLDEPAASAGNVGRRQWDGLADGIDRLLDTFAKGRLVFRRCGLLSAECTQAGAKHGTGRNRRRAEGEDGQHDREEHDDNQKQRHSESQTWIRMILRITKYPTVCKAIPATSKVWPIGSANSG